MKKKKVVLIIALTLVIIGGVSFGIVRQQNTKAERITQQKKKEVKKDEKEDKKSPYKNLSKIKAEEVAKLDGEVAKLVGQKKAIKPLDNLKNAETTLKELDSKDSDLKSVHEAYASVINTVKTPDLDTLQDARTAIANMNDSEISKHMVDTFEDNLIDIVSVAKLTDRERVVEATKPLTPQQAQAKKDKKAKEAKEAEAQAKADAEREKKEQAANEAAREAAKKAEAVNNAQTITGTEAPNGHEMESGGYETPTNDGGYTPPVNNGGGYVPPANNDGETSNNNASNNVQAPTPPKGDTITGTEAPNGHEMEPGGW